jgi:hypothetical protein
MENLPTASAFIVAALGLVPLGALLLADAIERVLRRRSDH